MKKCCNYNYKGAIHIHTNLSDGTGNIYNITEAAKKSGLDWIIVTDHNHYDCNEGIINGIYVIKGEEISPQTCNHYLALRINETIEPDSSLKYVDKVRECGGFGFAAHPDEGIILDDMGNLIPRKNSYHCIPWTDKNIIPDGIEIWNWFSNWADNLNDKSIFKLAYSYLFKNKIIKNPSKLTLEWWDKLNNNTENIIPAIGGVDAHALKIRKYIIPLTIFPYKTCFDTITNFINLKKPLSDDYAVAKKQILSAVIMGHNTIVNRKICKTVPLIYITNSQNICYPGETIELDDECYLHLESKIAFKICLIYNGIIQEIAITNKYNYHISLSGKYRVEVYSNGRGFLYTNPFYVRNRVEINEQRC